MNAPRPNRTARVLALAAAIALAGLGTGSAGASGHGARPVREEWVRSIRDQCDAAGVAFFFKQWGGVRKSATGRTLDGKTHDDIPAASPHPMVTPAARQEQLRRFELQLVSKA